MNITKKSQLTGLESTLDINITLDELSRVENRFETKELLQNIVPNLSTGDREFLKTGITPDDWEREFGNTID